MRGAVYEIRFGPTGDIWALTTGGVFTTANIHAEQGDQNDVSLALQWTRFALPVASSEVLLHIYQGDAGNIMLLTGEGLYMTTDLVNWYTVGAEVLNDSYIRDIYVKDSSLQSFIVVVAHAQVMVAVAVSCSAAIGLSCWRWCIYGCLTAVFVLHAILCL